MGTILESVSSRARALTRTSHGCAGSTRVSVAAVIVRDGPTTSSPRLSAPPSTLAFWHATSETLTRKECGVEFTNEKT